MVSQLIQRQVAIGSNATFALKSGQTVAGCLVEISIDYIVIEGIDQRISVPIEFVSHWSIAKATPDMGGPGDNDPPQPAIATPKESEFQVATAETAGDGTQHAAMIPADQLRKILLIEAQFTLRLESARLQFEAPVIKFPGDYPNYVRNPNINRRWQRIMNMYDYAVRMAELGEKFGRSARIAYELGELAALMPEVQTIRQYQIHFFILAGEFIRAIEVARELIIEFDDPADWYVLAELALRTNHTELVCYSLEQYFLKTPLLTDFDAWLVFIKMVQSHHNYVGLLKAVRVSRLDDLSNAAKLWETAIYLLNNYKQYAIVGEILQCEPGNVAWVERTSEALLKIAPDASANYQKAIAGLNLTHRPLLNERLVRQSDPFLPIHAQTLGSTGSSTIPVGELTGFIYKYFPDRNYGFIRTADGENDGGNYFFHRTAITDVSLLTLLANKDFSRPVVFEVAQGSQGRSLAVSLAIARSPEEIFELAQQYSDNGEYQRAAAEMRRVVNLDPNFPGAQDLYVRWSEFAMIRNIPAPRGNSLWARAKRAELIEKDLNRAVDLYLEAIRQGERLEGSIKDLAMIYTRLDQPDQAIDLLLSHRQHMREKLSVDMQLVTIYQKAARLDEAVKLLEDLLKQERTHTGRTKYQWSIGNIYVQQGLIIKAQQAFEAVLVLQPENIAAQRQIAICLMKQGDLEKAEQLLNRILDTFNDTQSVELLAAIRKIRATGQVSSLDEIISEAALTNFAQPTSGFAQFYLDRCEFKGVAPHIAQAHRFTRTDVNRLDDLATQLGVNRPRERAEYFLSAAKIDSIVENGELSPLFYKYLGRTFTSLGDAAIGAGGMLDSGRDLYCEALAVYDNVRDQLGMEQDNQNALIRFLYATLGAASVPLKSHGLTIEEAIDFVLARHPSRQQVFDAIAYLVYRSKHAGSYILQRLYKRETLQTMALQYLRDRFGDPAAPQNLDEFVRLWDRLRQEQMEEAREVSSDLRYLTRLNWTMATLEPSIERLRRLGERLFFGLDQQRLTEVRRILELVLDLQRQVTFEEQERLCFQIDRRCQDALRDMGDNPTKLSVEEFYPVIQVIQQKAEAWLEELYQRSAPDPSLRLAIESYTPDIDGQIEVQVVVENRLGRSPADALELVVQEEPELFVLRRDDLKLEESLRGGDHRIIRVPFQVQESAVMAGAFSMTVYAHYRTRVNEFKPTAIYNLPIRLSSEAEFEPIDNAYAAHSEGGPVEDPAMFYGRSELIANVGQMLRQEGSQSKNIVIYGQKRAGKSSILYHLKRQLECDPRLLIVDLDNIGSILDTNARVPFEYLILWEMLSRLQNAVEDRVSMPLSEDLPLLPMLDVTFPGFMQFFESPSPLQYFKEAFMTFRRSMERSDEWRNIRIVVLIDEFSYIYGEIVSKRIPETFMKNWKALLEANFFSVVLAGQDVMPRFKQRFPNEFGIIQDERISYLALDDARRLIDEPIRIGGRGGESRYREQAIERILELTAGSPFYIQIICNRLVQYMNRKRTPVVTRADIEQVKDELIRGVNALSLDKFDNLVNSGDTSPNAIKDHDILLVLREIAVNSQTGACVRTDITCEPDTPINMILDDLTNRDVLECERGQYYRIRIGLFQEWLVARQ
jgi:tetratricopeptide (TPR) repeat protein